MSSTTKILFIINPKSGTDRQKRLQKDIEKHLDFSRFDYSIQQTQYKGHGTELAQKAAENGFDIVVAVGGDGSVNDVIKGMYDTNLTLAIIPKGSGNGLARSLKIPLSTPKAIQLIQQQKTEYIDLGKVNGNIFVSNAGIGFDAVVAEKFAQSKGRGFWNYVLITIKSLWHYKHKDCSIYIDDKQIDCKATFIVSVANTEQFGYNFKIAPLADYKDGVFEIVVIQKFSILQSLGIALKAFSGKLFTSKFVHHYRASKLSIIPKEDTSLQIDGDYISSGNKEFHYQILKQKLKVIVGG